MNHGEGSAGKGGGWRWVDESLGWGQGGEMEKRGVESPGELDPSDGAAVASTAASTRRTAAQTCPSLLFLISLFPPLQTVGLTLPLSP